MALRKIFMKNKVLIDKEQVGGNVNRTVRLDIGPGHVFVKTSGSKEMKI
jgi:chemotaxis protein CheD